MSCRRVLTAAVLTLAAAAGTAAAAPPTDAQIDQVIATYRQAFERESVSVDELRAAAAEATRGLDINELTPVQIGRMLVLWGMIDALGGHSAAVKRLEGFLDDPGIQGATAAFFTLETRLEFAENDEARLAIYRGTLDHPGLEDAISAGALPNFFARLPVIRGGAAKAGAEELLKLERLLRPELAPQLATSYDFFFGRLETAFPDRPEEVQRIRENMVVLARGALDQLSEREARYVAESIAYLDGPSARGELMGNPAPALDITWSSDPMIKSLDGLKGRVVVLDFWATWCGPCVASLPKVRELAEHYKDHAVTIIGVTSLQGAHYPGDGQKAISTRDDPQREYALMAEYIITKDITWPIVFTRQNCSNGEYGVRGIPHVTIIDPAGKVRHNGLHPGGELATKISRIDALLEEFNLAKPAPAEPAPAPPSAGGS